jgi:hypothetical protein
MAKASKKSVVVEIPELDDLALDPAIASELDRLCAQSRALSAQIKYLEDGDPERGIVGKSEVSKQLKTMVEGLEIPDRVLGSGWDLRRQVRVSEKIDPAKLKMTLLHAGLQLKVACPRVIVIDDPNSPHVPFAATVVVVCPHCNGTGERVLEGLEAAKAVVEQCTDRTESVTVSVYARNEKG